MSAALDPQLETLFLMALAVFAVHLLHRLQSSAIRTKAVSTPDYLYKMARLTGASEYDIFCKSAEEWPVSEAMVKEHFRQYLLHQTTPCYVNAFVRKHKQKIDELRMPPV
jgi:hypothetical protein